MSWAIWITGLPGSGKTTLARAVAAALETRGYPVRVLELDEIRRVLTPTPTYSEVEREVVYRALGYMAKLMTEAGIPVIIDATAHRQAWRESARALIPAFAEVQLLCPLEVCQARERVRHARFAPAAVYAHAGRPGGAVPGVDIPYEPSPEPELVVDTQAMDLDAAVQEVLYLARRLHRRAAWLACRTRRPLPVR